MIVLNPRSGQPEPGEQPADIVNRLVNGVDPETILAELDWIDRPPLQAGTVWVNTYRAISFISPFGGCKMSGLGRENGAEAIREYLQTKSVWISTASEVPNPFALR